jgi:hypothetical protein
MGRRISTSPVRFDITGLDPQIFELCRQNKLEIIEERSKGRMVSSSTDPQDNFEDMRRDPELASLSKNQFDVYNRVVSIAIDFERAYGRTVYIRVFRRSPNKFLNLFSSSGRSKNQSQMASDLKPTFLVNGVKVFVGVPNSFSELDEAIDRAFGRHAGGGRQELV